MARSLTQKLIDSHLVAGKPVAGHEIGISVDQVLLTDTNGTMSWLQFEAMGFPRAVPARIVSYADHNVYQVDSRNSDDHRYMQAVSRKYGAVFSKPGNGICHQVHMESFSIPGQTLLGTDSHTPLCGAAGMLAIGAGGLDVAVALGGGPYFFQMPKVVRVHLTGAPDRVVPVEEVAGTAVEQVMVGSCTNGSWHDMASVTDIVRGRRVHSSVSFVLFPGSHKILETMAREGLLTDLLAAGATVSESSCGACAGIGHVPAAGAKSLRAFNRNFPGRSGVKDDSVYLCSSTVAAASALTGVITDPRTLGAPTPVTMPPRFASSTVGFVEPDGTGEIPRGPNIKPVPLGEPVAETLDDPADFTGIEQDDRLQLPGLRAALAAGERVRVENTRTGAVFTASCVLTPRERDILLAGGILAHTKAGQEKNGT